MTGSTGIKMAEKIQLDWMCIDIASKSLAPYHHLLLFELMIT
jgi:hypothetical protein